MMMVCARCGDLIHRRTNVAYSDRHPHPAPDVRPWLHLHGMDYEQRGFAPHDAIPAISEEDDPMNSATRCAVCGGLNPGHPSHVRCM